MITLFQTARVDLALLIQLIQKTSKSLWNTWPCYTLAELTMASDSSNMFPFQFGPDPFPVNRPLQVYGNDMKSIYCIPCKTRFGVEKYHRHHSTQHFHATKARTSDVVECPTCKVVHPIKEERQFKVILVTSSTLHNVYLHPKMRSPVHFDTESIPGARLHELYRAWKAAYNNAFPQHVILVGGLNDVERTPISSIKSCLVNWSIELKELNDKNSFRVCKLLKPPKLVWLPGNVGSPPRNHVNYLNKIEEINSFIDGLNSTNGHPDMIGFGSEGIRKSRKRDESGQQLLMHKLSSWREHARGPAHCLHINDEGRLNMLKRLVRYMMNNLE